MQLETYETLDPSFGDLSLETQIEYKINLWVCVGETGHKYFGGTKEEAIKICNMYE